MTTQVKEKEKKKLEILTAFSSCAWSMYTFLLFLKNFVSK